MSRCPAGVAGRGSGRSGAQRGFTLIELVMTLLLLAIGVPALINLGSQCLQNLHQGAYNTVATALSQEKLERILNDVNNSSRGASYVVSGNYPAEASIAGFTGYSRSVTIDPDSTYNSITFRNVKVTTTAPDGTTLVLSTWVTP